MDPLVYTFQPLAIPLRAAFTQASRHRVASESVWATARRGDVVGVGEGCPRTYQTGEDVTSALAWLAGLPPIRGLADLDAIAADAPPAAFCAVECATLDVLAREAGQSVAALLGLPPPPTRLRYTTVVGMRPGDALLDRLPGLQITELKVKVGLDLAADLDLLAALRARVPDARIRLDANNAFGHDADAAARHLAALPGWWAVEEPLAPGQPAAAAWLGRTLGRPLILDEAIGGPADLARYAAEDAAWILNLKVSRVGGVRRALALVAAAQAADWPVIVGAQAGETSVLTAAGHLVAGAAGAHLAGLEGGVGRLLLAWEPVEPSLTYGPGGWFDRDHFDLDAAGFGLRPLPWPETPSSPCA